MLKGGFSSAIKTEYEIKQCKLTYHWRNVDHWRNIMSIQRTTQPQHTHSSCQLTAGSTLYIWYTGFPQSKSSRNRLPKPKTYMETTMPLDVSWAESYPHQVGPLSAWHWAQAGPLPSPWVQDDLASHTSLHSCSWVSKQMHDEKLACLEIKL